MAIFTRGNVLSAGCNHNNLWSFEHTDSLALDKLSNHSKWLVPWIGERSNAVLELRTKSAKVDNLIGLEHNG